MNASRPTAWITGAGGLIGNYLVQTAQACASAWEIVPLSRRQLDLTDFAAVRDAFQSRRPQLVIHCAALSRGPACQADPPLARKLNVEVTAFLAELAADIPFIFFSSDLVFDGARATSTNPRHRTLSVSMPKLKSPPRQIVLANPGTPWYPR